jgi:molybdopterin-containing oxidoreductase family membrane subunit
LVPWIYTAMALEVIGLGILMIHRLRETTTWLNVACMFVIVGIWIEKGMGLIVPGFIPTPLGEIVEYSPTVVEILVSLAIWAIGLLVFTVLAKAAVAIDTGALTFHAAQPDRVGAK